MIMFLAREALFLRRSDDLAVDEERNGGVMVEGRDTEDPSRTRCHRPIPHASLPASPPGDPLRARASDEPSPLHWPPPKNTPENSTLR